MNAITETLSGVLVATRANVDFDGRCISLTVTLPDGSRKSGGSVLPSTLTSTTGAPKVMEGVAGACEVLPPSTNAYINTGEEGVAGACEVLPPEQTQWQRFGPGERFAVPSNASFPIRVTDQPYHSICHFG